MFNVLGPERLDSASKVVSYMSAHGNLRYKACAISEISREKLPTALFRFHFLLLGSGLCSFVISIILIHVSGTRNLQAYCEII